MSGPVAVHHLVAGPLDAPVLVLIPSLGTDLGVWEPQVPALARACRVIRYDTRGHGRSPVPEGPYTLADLGADLLGLLDRLGIGRADLCGLSIGGMAAMWAAAHAPERVGRLTLLCTSAWLDREVYARRADLVRRAGLASVADGVVGRWFTPGFAQREPDRVAAARRMLLATPAEGYAGSCEAIAAMDLQPDLWRILAPTLIVAGADDLAIPPGHAERLAANIAGSRLAIVPQAAHLANVERPAAVTALIAAHLGVDGSEEAV
ncbi:MAG: 3-oxoadipate enol-lactonase [Candidatus Limnocylindrales bacterium]